MILGFFIYQSALKKKQIKITFSVLSFWSGLDPEKAEDEDELRSSSKQQFIILISDSSWSKLEMKLNIVQKMLIKTLNKIEYCSKNVDQNCK